MSEYPQFAIAIDSCRKKSIIIFVQIDHKKTSYEYQQIVLSEINSMRRNNGLTNIIFDEVSSQVFSNECKKFHLNQIDNVLANLDDLATNFSSFFHESASYCSVIGYGNFMNSLFESMRSPKFSNLFHSDFTHIGIGYDSNREKSTFVFIFLTKRPSKLECQKAILNEINLFRTEHHENSISLNEEATKLFSKEAKKFVQGQIESVLQNFKSVVTCCQTFDIEKALSTHWEENINVLKSISHSIRTSERFEILKSNFLEIGIGFYSTSRKSALILRVQRLRGVSHSSER